MNRGNLCLYISLVEFIFVSFLFMQYITISSDTYTFRSYFIMHKFSIITCKFELVLVMLYFKQISGFTNIWTAN